MKLAKNERLLLYLLSRALRGERGRVSYFPEEAERIAANHGVLPLLFDVVSPPEGSGMARATMQCVQQSYHLLVASRRYAALLQEGGCAVAVLKGASIAAVYPVPEYRKSGDLDILLLRRQDFERADAILRSAGAVVQESQHANHHVAYDLPEGFDLELHMSLVEDFDNKSVNRTLAVMQERMPYATRTVLGAELPVLEDGEQALSLLLHMLQHYLRAGFGLKLLCDWVCFWKGGVAKEQRERYRSHIERLGLEGFSEMVTDACCRYLGLPRNAVADLLPEDNEERAVLCVKFLREIFDSEEFGKTSVDRMVVLRGTGILDYVREFHHQMHLNFPRAGRWPLLWPGLWGVTLVRFLRNNRRYRKTSLFRVLQTTKERSKLSPVLRLFEKIDTSNCEK